MENTKKKRGRPPKIYTAETTDMTYEGMINFNLNKQVKSELDKTLADKPESQLTDDERKYLDLQKENKTRMLNIRFTESEYQDIENKCQQYGYKKKSEYVRDCVRARVPSVVQQVDLSETNRLLKAVGNNINQIAVRLHSTGNFYAEDMSEIKKGVSEVWQLLISIQSKQISAEQSATSLTQIRPSTDYSYTWNNIKVVTTLDKGFSLNTSTSITVYVDDCPGGAAIVKLYKFGDINPVRSFSLPSAPMPSQAVSVSLTAGSYYWTVQPNGCESTSGSLYVTGVDGVTDVP